MNPDSVEAAYRSALRELNLILLDGHVSKTVLMCALDADLLPPAWMEHVPLLRPATPTPAHQDPLNDLRTFIP